MRFLALALLVGCGAGSSSSSSSVGSGSGSAATPVVVTDAAVVTAPPVNLPVQAAVLAVSGDHSCGKASTKSFATRDVPLLGDRLRVKFLPKPTVEGNGESMRATSGTAFVGARELYMKGDSDFTRHATTKAAFKGDYDPVTIMGRDGQPIVTGLLKAAPAGSDLVSVAHGWFLNADGDVLDIAVFASGVTDANLAECRLFGASVIATASAGPTKLAFGTGAAVETEVSYATFRYVLPADWIMTSGEGIHDFARITFRHRGLYPDGFTQVQLALDSHPGDWNSPGDPDGTQAGKLFGLDVTWNHTKGDAVLGTWTVSSGTVRRDHAVGSIVSGTTTGRDAAIQFAQSITTK